MLENPVSEDGVSQCFRKVVVRMHVYTSPAYASNPIEGIQKEHLDPLILHYDANAGGVVVSYNNVKLQRRKGTSQPLGDIRNESPFSFHWITAELLVWFPQPNDVVEGWVSVQSPGHLALLIHDTFNATVKRNDIPASWTFVPQEDDEADNNNKSLGYWQDSQGNRIDGKLQFTVKRFLHGGRTPLVLGSLLTEEDLNPQYQEETVGETAVETEGVEQEAPEEAQKPKKIKFD